MLVIQPGDARLGDYLRAQFADKRWRDFVAAVAFVKRSGVQYLADSLREFAARGRIRIIAGVDLGGTSREGLADLLDCVGDTGEVWVFHNESASTFHPKLYLFKNADEARLLVGSGNLTQGGLFTNYEASLIRSLELSRDHDQLVLKQAEAALTRWMDPAIGTCRRLTPGFLDQLYSSGYVTDEANAAGEAEDRSAANRSVGWHGPAPHGLFGRVAVPRPPRVARRSRARRQHLVHVAVPVTGAEISTFVMTLQQTDAGVGQVTAGAARRSPEVFIPLAARDQAPEFWGWPDEFSEDPSRSGKFDRTSVLMALDGETIRVNMMTWPVKHDFRLRSARLRDAAVVGDVLEMERLAPNAPQHYRVAIIKKGTLRHARYLAQCTESVPNSRKRWGYF